MHLQVLIHPERVEAFSVEARQEHSHNDEQIDVLVLHSQGEILVVVLKLVGAGVVAGTKLMVVFLDATLQEILTR